MLVVLLLTSGGSILASVWIITNDVVLDMAGDLNASTSIMRLANW